jgi:phosphoserine aminotransferase
MKSRGYYFGAGPACLPESVLEQAQKDLWNWQGQGVSILELGFRTPAFMDLMQETEADFRQILGIPDDFAVLFVGGPARAQFSYLPLNLLQDAEHAAYTLTGTWSKMAFEEAQRLLPNQHYVYQSGAERSFMDAPKKMTALKSQTKYHYFCSNETISGLEYQPQERNLPWVADMTSNILTSSIDFNNYGLIFAGAQKNMANAGLTIVMVRRDFLPEQTNLILPLMNDYRLYIREQSLYATPPTFNIYMMHSILKWMQAQGGLAHFEALSQRKSQLLYDFLDHSKQFHTYIQGPLRSRVNVTFTTKNPERDLEIVKMAEENGLYGLKGHRSLGGLRASLYNPMPLSGVEALVHFLDQLPF